MPPRTAGPEPRAPRYRVVATFLVVVAGLLMVDALVWVAIRPRLRELQAIGRDHARSLELTADLRSRLSSMRGEVVRSVAIEPGTASAVPPASSFRDLDAVAASLEPYADEGFERRHLTALRTALGTCEAESGAIAALLARGDRTRARAALDDFLQTTGAATEVIDEIARLNARRVEESALGVERSLRATLIGAGIVTLLGLAAALLLMRYALRGMSSHQDLWRAHTAEVDAFAARAAHELRTPLQTLALSLAMLDASPEGTRALERARASTDRLRRTIDALLEFSRAGVEVDRASTSDLAESLGDVREELEVLLESGGTALDLDLEPGLRVAIAPEHLRTILRNLVGNAAKYARDVERAHVTVRARGDAGSVRLEVADNGPGIPPDAVRRVFEPFFRASRRAEGHGLGLATVERLARAYSGDVALESELGRGTTVRVTLPAAPAGASIGPPSISARPNA